jgi:transposase InsO family protein
VIVFYDDYSSHAWISCLRQKSSAISATKQFIAMVNTYYESAVQSWMSDAGGEYKSDVFNNMLRDQRINILTSTPHIPQQNGRAERFMRTFMDKAEAMCFTACIPQS